MSSAWYNDCSDNVIGVDDVLAMLLALAAKPEELEILLLSVTYGNVEAQRYAFSPTQFSTPLKLI